MYRLIYKSKAAEKITKEMFRDILYSSLDQNRNQTVNGALLATHTHFLQFLEGGFHEVNETFFRIVKDPRHTEMQLISFRKVEIPLFDSWRMKGFGIFNLNPELDRKLKISYGEENGGVCFPVDEKTAHCLIQEVELIKEIARVDQ